MLAINLQKSVPQNFPILEATKHMHYGMYDMNGTYVG